MKIEIQFANGENRILEVHGTDFDVACKKLLLPGYIKTDSYEIFMAAMVVKMEKVDDQG